MDSPLRDRRWALVTGASRGIGAAVAQELAQLGWSLILVARDSEKLELLASQLRTHGGDIFVEVFDLQDTQAWEKRIQQLDEVVGPIDLVLANAGVSLGGRRQSGGLAWQELAPIIHTNISACWVTLGALAMRMRARGRGQLVGIGSFAGDRGYPTSAAYCASKAALRIYLESLRESLHATGVGVTEVRLGYVDTDMIRDSKKYGSVLSAEQAAKAIVTAIAKRRAVAMIPKRMYWMSLGLSLLPRSLWRNAKR